MDRTKTSGAIQEVPVWNVQAIHYQRYNIGVDQHLSRTKTSGAFQAVPVWNVQTFVITPEKSFKNGISVIKG